MMLHILWLVVVALAVVKVDKAILERVVPVEVVMVVEVVH
jgi:hypothetical protein